MNINDAMNILSHTHWLKSSGALNCVMFIQCLTRYSVMETLSKVNNAISLLEKTTENFFFFNQKSYFAWMKNCSVKSIKVLRKIRNILKLKNKLSKQKGNYFKNWKFCVYLHLLSSTNSICMKTYQLTKWISTLKLQMC